ncbi:hypothetical protein FC83_GL000231 [Agrilactobacillus composti DSM 18527 = JCM 14202]|uniref:Surface layer protein A domain-containing protein n=1 Tax=Agrilactobacillus composti DSM 18527 = JCM 14202 TaxID=1423734 RepID=X0PTK4_9LACO|nr:hypothetical protein [Agrilactobacillus composti]KRM32829.1 hypothetical protein FC83_GL000231 [Agrilactobacillus composti DSM 18527 = JCM 14202]GAF40636.1 hypothetical protein JCM14202_2542 [Agrilactobacillus composti DSM 18527 = JCM 14202]
MKRKSKISLALLLSVLVAPSYCGSQPALAKTYTDAEIINYEKAHGMSIGYTPEQQAAFTKETRSALESYDNTVDDVTDWIDAGSQPQATADKAATAPQKSDNAPVQPTENTNNMGPNQSDNLSTTVSSSVIEPSTPINNNLNISPNQTGTAVYSNYSPLTIYQDAETTSQSGALDANCNEWAATHVAKDSCNNILAYDLGNNQWVKASQLSKTAPISGIFVTSPNTPLFFTDGTLASCLQNGGTYQVFAVTYINGRQALKLGSEAQWVLTATGAYYPQ